jgi:tRNA uridine 5-carboxymethylaminomethyl modification enzyme
VRRLALDNLPESPLFNGQIRGIGPRYCPSLEDKIVRFSDRERHQLFLEPEGVDAREIYVNGLSTSLPREVQADLVRALPGLEDARILRHGYAVEYDFVQPTELTRRLETKRVRGLFFAGQVNGTSGYDEAAAQGIVAGINAAHACTGGSGLELRRDEAYIGILVDDLITKGCLEPYRMFTSRAEHRLLLRIDNADLRLTPLGRAAGLVDDERWERFERRKGRFERNLGRLETTLVKTESGNRVSASQVLRQPGITLASLIRSGRLPGLELDASDAAVDESSLETAVKYAGYLRRQESEIERAKKDERRRIPSGFRYEAVPGLSREIVQRLSQVRPESLGHALRVPGVTPAAISVLSSYIGRAPS